MKIRDWSLIFDFEDDDDVDIKSNIVVAISHFPWAIRYGKSD